jgi:DNA polymerase-3 subunit alpha
MGGSRAQMMAGVEKAIQMGQRVQADRSSGQMNLFGGGGGADLDKDHEALPKVQPWTEMQMLTYEKDVLGMFVTKNPLSKHATELDAYSSTNTGELSERKSGAEVIIGGMVTKIRNIVTKNGRNAGAKMAVFELEDLQGKCEVVMFPKVLEKFNDLLAVDEIVFVKGTVDTSRETPNVLCDELIGLQEVGDKLSACVRIELADYDVTEELIARVRGLCEKHRGKSPVQINITTHSGYRISTVADRKYSVKPDVEYTETLRGIVGRKKVALCRR